VHEHTSRKGVLRLAPAALLTALFLSAAALPASAQHSAFLLDAISADLGRPGEIVSPLDMEFTRAQLRNPRVLRARLDARLNLKRLFHAARVPYRAEQVYLRAFKRERALELWVKPRGAEVFTLIKTYDVCSISGDLGPKRRQGDRQVPEGYYEIDLFNPISDYLLSLHVNYPNNVDRAQPGRGGNMGGDIYIHGGCQSIGCLAMTDEGIEELYWMAVEVRAAGQTRIPVHIFPARLDDEGFNRLVKSFAKQPQLGAFWSNLKPGFDYFEEHRRLPLVVAGTDGKYRYSDLADASRRVKNGSRAVDAQLEPSKSAAGTGTGATSR
jgi:murein L,D-transpeptidase YafK